MSSTSDREIIITRTINAPRSLVWKMWTEPEHLEKWWGPNGFSVTTSSIDIRKGGTWDFIMHGPDGTDYPNRIIFTDIVEHELIAHDHGGDGKDGKDVHFNAVITFEDVDGQTLVTMKSVFATAADRDHVVKEYGAIEGGTQTLGKLAAYVESMK